ncbi:MAG TPA: YciI family protein [Kofleriaceae bacterium]|nr:YciI family protein [Kofleriaceae bacterium]
MRIFSIIPADENSEAGLPPPAGLIEEMMRLGAESAARGVLLDQGGLQPSKYGARVEFKNGKPRVTDGPFAETKELIAGYAILRVTDLEDGIAEAKKLPLRCEVEIRPIFELGEPLTNVTPRKPGTKRYMLVFKAGAESTEPPSQEIIQAMGAYNDSLTAAGALLAGEGLQPSVAAARVDLSTGEIKRGPFDPKGLVTGWWMIQAKDKSEAIEWAKRVPIPEGVIEVRPVMDPGESCAQGAHDLAAAAS